MKRLVLALALVCFLSLPARPLFACPNCQEALANSVKLESEKDNTPAAFNQSIYLMVGVPYVAFGVVAFLIYRGIKKNAEHLARARGEAGATTA